MNREQESSKKKNVVSPKHVIEEKQVHSIVELISSVKEDFIKWTTTTYPWFRGEPGCVPDPLLPKLYRNQHNENQLLQNFRMKAPSLGIMSTPARDHTDEWLFLPNMWDFQQDYLIGLRAYLLLSYLL